MNEKQKYVGMKASASFSPRITLGELLKQAQQNKMKSNAQIKNSTEAETQNKADKN